MKKCASCSKDLPDAALHCVFCGAKQAAAPAVQPGLAKTAFGYSQNEVMQQLGRPQAQPAPQPSGLAPPAAHAQPTAFEPPRAHSPSQGPYGQQGGLANPNVAANAATMMVGPGQGPGFQPSPSSPQTPFSQGAPYQPPQQQPYQAPQQQPYSGGGGMGIHSPPQPTPAPLPTAAPPYLASQTAARAGRPIEPWKDTLKLMMLIFGALALVSFATPVRVDPMAFNWDAIIHAPGKMKIGPLIWATVGLLSIAMALIPMASAPRGAIALVLGLAGVVTPLALLGGAPPWQALLSLAGLMLLIPGLLVRDEYTESLLARVLVTIGVICVLLPLLIPTNGEIRLVGMFKGLLDAPGEAKVGYILELATVVVVVMSLLVWMPGPATAGAKIFAWVLLGLLVADSLVPLVVSGEIGDILSKAPGAAVQWVPMMVYMVLIGYGGATVIGKQLE